MSGSALTGPVALGTLLLSAPVLRLLADGRLSPEQAAVRCLLALLVVWAGATAVAVLLRSYAAPAEPPTGASAGRRADDLPAAPG